MSNNKKQLHITAFIMSGFTAQSWRHPELPSNSAFDINYYVEAGKIADRGLFDALFLADTAAFPTAPDEVLKRMPGISLFEPATLMATIAAHTKHVGLIYTSSISNTEPTELARQTASLDHLSGGRIGWNLVTTYGPGSLHLGLPPKKEDDDSYARAAEYVDVVTGLWDSFEDDAFVQDKASGVYTDTSKIHRVNYSGQYYKTNGPLRMARPVQGHPVIAQAGASEKGRTFGAQTADLIFCNSLTLESGQAFYADIKRRAVEAGRNPDHIKVMPGCSIVWGETDEIANAKLDEISRLFPIDVAVENLMLGLHGYDLDAPFPRDMPPAQFSVGHQREITSFAVKYNLTLRQTAQRLAVGNKHRVVAGSTKTIADDLELWINESGCDGITLMAPYLLDGFNDFVTHVVPELQRRGIYRQAYEGTTLRESLGIPRPVNQFIEG